MMRIRQWTRTNAIRMLALAWIAILFIGAGPSALAYSVNLGNLNGKQYNRTGFMNNNTTAYDDYTFSLAGQTRLVVAMTGNHQRAGWALMTGNDRFLLFQPKTSSGQATRGITLQKGSYKVRVFRIPNHNFQYHLRMTATAYKPAKIVVKRPTVSTPTVYTPRRTTTTTTRTTPQPRVTDRGVNNMLSARSLGFANRQGIRLSDSIGNNDRQDWWAFTAGNNNPSQRTKAVTILLTGLQGNVDLIAYDGFGRQLNRVVHRPNSRVISPSTSNNGRLMMSTSFPVGTCYVRVVHYNGANSNYTIEIKGY